MSEAFNRMYRRASIVTMASAGPGAEYGICWVTSQSESQVFVAYMSGGKVWKDSLDKKTIVSLQYLS